MHLWILLAFPLKCIFFIYLHYMWKCADNTPVALYLTSYGSYGDLLQHSRIHQTIGSDDLQSVFSTTMCSHASLQHGIKHLCAPEILKTFESSYVNDKEEGFTL